MKKTMKKSTKGFLNNLITYAIVIIAFVFTQMALSKMIPGVTISRSLKGQLIPICVYIVMAVSLNLTVGISGELSLGHAGFMSVGAFSGIIMSGWLLNAFQMENETMRLVLAMLAGMAGALFGLNFSSIAPDKFKFDTSILVLVFVVLGGIGNIRGSVIAAALLTVLPEVLREFGDYRMLIYAIVLIAVMLLGNAPVVRQVFERIRPAKKEVVKEGDAA